MNPPTCTTKKEQNFKEIETKSTIVKKCNLKKERRRIY